MSEPKVEVDRVLCFGSGDCLRLAPTAFDLDEEGLSTVIDASSVSLETLRAVERSCPSGAISIDE